MFETSVVQARARAASGRFTLLTLSVVAHSAVIVGVLTYSIATMEFPVTAPDAYAMAPLMLPVVVPPPLGTQVRPVQPQPPRAPAPPQQTAQATAPPVIPDAIPEVPLPSSGDAQLTGPGTGDPAGSATPGVPEGTEGGTGDPGTSPFAQSGPPVEPRIYQPHEVKAPVLLHRVDPAYPPAFARIGLAAMVVVRCVIDRNGHVRNAEVVTSAAKPFDDAVIAALQQWRYTPASIRGVAVDSYLDVTVRFSIHR